MKDLKEQSLATFDKILAPTGLALLSSMPEIQMPLMLAYGFFGVVMQYKQDDVNNFIKILQDNPGIFTKEIVNTKEFQDGFVIILEQYIKERNNSKKEIIKNIFLGFTKISKEKKEEFELERLLDITNKITFDEIKYLKKIYKVSSEYKTFNFTTDKGIDSSQKDYIDIIYGLVSLGVIFPIETNTVENPYDSEDSINGVLAHFEPSFIGMQFLEYILK